MIHLRLLQLKEVADDNLKFDKNGESSQKG